MRDDGDRYNPLALIVIVVMVLLGFIAFYVTFVTVPLILLGAFYLYATLRDRNEARRTARLANREEGT